MNYLGFKTDIEKSTIIFEDIRCFFLFGDLMKAKRESNG